MQTLNMNLTELHEWVADVLKNAPVKYLALPRDSDSEPHSKDRAYLQGSSDVDVLVDRIDAYPEAKLIFETDRYGTNVRELQVQTKVIKQGADRILNADETIIQLTALTEMDLKKPSNTILGDTVTED